MSETVRLSPRARAELCVGYGLILATLWTPNPGQRILYWFAFAWIASTAILRYARNHHGAPTHFPPIQPAR